MSRRDRIGLTSLMLRAFLPRRPPEPSFLTVAFDDEIYEVHARARRYTLRIHAASREIVLSMPLRGSLREANVFAQKHGAWIAARLKRLPRPAPFAHGAVVPLRGVDHRI